MENSSTQQFALSGKNRHRCQPRRPGINFRFPVIAGLAALMLPLSVRAAAVTWGAWTAVTNNTAIQIPGGYPTFGGVNFNGSTTTINNGPGGTGGTDVTFTGIALNGSGTTAGITVGTSGFRFQSTGNNSNVTSAVGSPQTWTTVLDRVIGDDGTVDAVITLSGLAIGSSYYVQFFSSAPDANILTNSKLTSGGGDSPFFGSHSSGGTKFITATFTADATSQSFALAGAEPTYSALVIGVQPAGGGDTTPPAWIATWPKAEPLSPTSLAVRARLNEAGVAYYVLLPDGAAAPSITQIIAGRDSTNTPVSTSGSLMLTANTEASAPVTGLSPGTAYDVYFVAEDAMPNLQTAAVKVDASTPVPDTTAPAWIATWPQAAQASATSLTVLARTNETGIAYYVVLPAGAPAPSADQVKAGTDSANTPATASGTLALTANSEATAPVTGLAPDSSYDVYFIAEDAVPNLQATPVLVNVALVTPTAVTWGAWTGVSDASAILTPPGYLYGGVNFNGSDTTIGSVVFKGTAWNAGGTTRGITVGTTGFAFQSTGSGNSNVVSAAGSPQTWATVLDRVIGDDDNSASINLSGLTPGTAYTVQFFSSAPDVNILSNAKLTSEGVDSPFFGNHVSGETRSIIASFTANSSSQSFSITGREPTFGALVIGVQSSGNSFADWIGGFNVGSLTGFYDDADFDGLANGLENFLGTAPNAASAGLITGTLSGNTFTFSHPQNATPAADVSAPAYTWSTDLQTFRASGATSGGSTVNLAASPDTPTAGTTTVTATVAGTIPSKLFFRLSVSPQ